MSVRTVETGWQRRAACRGPESALFYPPTLAEARPDRDVREARAKAICATCDVKAECLECALAIREPHGIWGGLNENERRDLLDPTEARTYST